MKLSRDSWSVVGATLALLVYGALQERVMTRSYGSGSNKELFPHSAFLVLCNRLLTVLVLVLHSHFNGLNFTPVAPVHAYCLVSASNMLSTLCQYEALKYVSFVTQTLAKTSKALPVVLWGTLIGSRRYKAEQYIHAVLVTTGCSVFVLGGDITSAAAAHRGTGSWLTYGVGMVLLLVYLAADGWTSTQQEHLFKAYSTCVREQLLYTTAFSALYSLVVTIAGGQLTPAVGFLLRHPSAAAAVLGLSVMSTVIQVCISHVLQQHGALVFALMMTTRQCASVLLSSLLFGHMLTLSQWLGVAVVFAALYHQKAGKLSHTHSRHSTAGRLPQSRESAGGAAVALLSKAPLQQQQQTQQQMSASGVRGIYSSRVASHAGGLPPGGGVPGNQSHAVHNGSSSSSSQNPQQHARQVKGDTQSGTSVRGISSSGHVLQPLAVRPQAAVLTGGLLQQQSATPRMHSRGGAAAAAGAHTATPLPQQPIQPPALLVPQLWLPAGLKKMLGHSNAPVLAQAAEGHTE